MHTGAEYIELPHRFWTAPERQVKRWAVDPYVFAFLWHTANGLGNELMPPGRPLPGAIGQPLETHPFGEAGDVASNGGKSNEAWSVGKTP